MDDPHDYLPPAYLSGRARARTLKQQRDNDTVYIVRILSIVFVAALTVLVTGIVLYANWGL